MFIFLYDANGNIVERGQRNITTWDNASYYTPNVAGHLLVADTDITAQDAFNHPAHYQVQNGTLVSVVTPAQLLAEAQVAQIGLIQAGYAATVNAGFQATIGTTTYTFGWRQDAAHNDQLHLTQVQQAIDKALEVFPVPYADINAAPVNIPDQTTLSALETKANSFAWNQVKQMRTLIGQVMVATTVSAVQAIVWTPATY